MGVHVRMVHFLDDLNLKGILNQIIQCDVSSQERKYQNVLIISQDCVWASTKAEMRV